MNYFVVIDHDHLDNGVFLTALARALADLQERKVENIIVLHGDSEYTERLIQTGIMREEATVRAARDLNHRLIALLADQGVSAVGLNGYQREAITLQYGELEINKTPFDRLYSGPVLVLSNLVLDKETEKPVPTPLPRYVEFLEEQFNPDEVFVFSKFDYISPKEKESVSETEDRTPDDLKGLSIPHQIIEVNQFTDAL